MQFEERLHQPRKYSITVTLEKVVLTFDKKLFGESSAKSTSTRVYIASVIFSALPVFFSEKSSRAKRGERTCIDRVALQAKRQRRAFCVGHTSSRGNFQFTIKRRSICNLMEGSRIWIGALCPVSFGAIHPPIFPLQVFSLVSLFNVLSRPRLASHSTRAKENYADRLANTEPRRENFAVRRASRENVICTLQINDCSSIIPVCLGLRLEFVSLINNSTPIGWTIAWTRRILCRSSYREAGTCDTRQTLETRKPATITGQIGAVNGVN